MIQYPHVFSTQKIDTVMRLSRNGRVLSKQKQKIHDGYYPNLPALLSAENTEKASKVGFDW